jgi:hypothetical protein
MGVANLPVGLLVALLKYPALYAVAVVVLALVVVIGAWL